MYISYLCVAVIVFFFTASCTQTKATTLIGGTVSNGTNRIDLFELSGLLCDFLLGDWNYIGLLPLTGDIPRVQEET